ncbi:hypothetical protein AUR64_10995 [Haloprofundus marisrubri]|uniref:Uncharacterized protein n=1 Tax=Haloprofundus marisrubri TaxID=1514971 RepID=A0A0W1RAJ1_9EURY|nr:hypothetical protein [Haloprofundus marisrubri]KTG10114.1 hypothetical protein AUR64_10995 [Haloprofundus marisrubri]
MSLVSVSCPSCGGSVYVSLPVGRRFVTAEPGEGEEGASDLETTTATCSACSESFPVVHGSGSGAE